MREVFRKSAAWLYVLFLVAALCFFAVQSVRIQPVHNSDNARAISEVFLKTDTDTGAFELPAKLSELAQRSNVTLTAVVQAKPGDFLLMKSVFAPLRVYMNDALVYEFGQGGSYPAYMNDPPTNLALLPLPAEDGAVSLRMEYQSPTQRSELSFPAMFVGTEQALLSRQFQQDGFTFLFSLLLMFIGLAMTLIVVSFVSKIRSGTAFLWLGLFSLSAGIWSFGECDLSVLLLPYPSLLYAMSYLGLFLVTIPLLRFGLMVLQPKNRLPMQAMLYLHYISVAAALLLQLTGQMDFTKSLYLFHIIAPLGFVTFAVCLLWEHFRHQNPAARRFGIGIVILAIAVVLELYNYWLHLIGVLTLFFQIGVLGFVVSLGVASGYYMRNSLKTAAEKTRLEYEMAGMERQLSLQRQQYQKLAEHDELIKAQRHDLRHQLAVLRSLSADEKRLSEYIDRLTEKIPSGDGVRLCENYAVNAVAAYYYGMAQQSGIETDVSLIVPMELEANVESDLCVVVGNLMENAVEACARMESGRQFIHVGSKLQYGVLTITVDNSFAGAVQKRDKSFLSSKREGEGTGISSVAMVAKRHDGNTRFESKDGMFQASVYLKILKEAE